MTTITIDGVIGWDISAADIRQKIREAKGDNLLIEINSPGGMVTEGIAIFNAIKNAPGVKESLITGIAASMGSYIALAADRVTAEANAIYMVHNAMGVGIGNHHELRKTADIIEGMSKILASAYIGKTGKTPEEIAAMMDAETFLFGNEIMEAGFADAITGEKQAEKASAVMQTRAAVASAEDLIKRLSTERDTEQAAAMLAEYIPKPKNENTVAVGSVQAAGPKAKKEVSKMTEQEIEALKAESYQAGIQAERARVAGLKPWADISPECAKIVAEAEASGKDYTAVASQLAAAAAKSSRQADGENAPMVATRTAINGGNAVADEVPGMSADDVRALRAAGMSIEEIRANAPKGV
jgi:ATP-dependent protease ClpP protease subunit